MEPTCVSGVSRSDEAGERPLTEALPWLPGLERLLVVADAAAVAGAGVGVGTGAIGPRGARLVDGVRSLVSGSLFFPPNSGPVSEVSIVSLRSAPPASPDG